MDKNLSRAIAQRFRALRRVRGKDYSLVLLYESELKGALSILQDLGLISLGEWYRLNSLASKLYLLASGCGWHSVRQYNAGLASRSSATSSEKVVQDEPAFESVSAPAAPGAVRLRGVLVQSPASQVAEKPSRVAIRIIDFDGYRVDRSEFLRLSRHWFPFYLQSSRSSRLVN